MEKKDKIVYCFKQLSEEKGFCKATVSELAIKSNISKRTIYRYFNSKEELIEAVMQKFFNDMERELSSTLKHSDDPIRRVSCYVKQLSKWNIKLNNLIDMRMNYPLIWAKAEKFREEKAKCLISILGDGINKGHFKRINTTIVAASLLASIYTVVNPTLIMGNNIAAEEALQTVIDTFLLGIASENRIS